MTKQRWMRLGLLLAIGLGILVPVLTRSPPPPEGPGVDPFALDDYPLAGADPDPEAPAWKDYRLAVDDTFEFQLGQGSGMHGLDLIKIAADGKVVYEYQGSREGGGRWGRKSFRISRA